VCTIVLSHTLQTNAIFNIQFTVMVGICVHTLSKKGTKAVMGLYLFKRYILYPKAAYWYLSGILAPKMYILPPKIDILAHEMDILAPKMYILTLKIYILVPKMDMLPPKMSIL